MFTENISLALNSLRCNKMRAFLTMLGIIIGIGAVIAIMTVGGAMTKSVTDAMASMGANNITISLKQKDETPEMTESGAVFGTDNQESSPSERDYFTLDMINSLCKKYPDQIKAISATDSVGSGTSKIGKDSVNLSVTGASMGYFLSANLTILAGDYISENELVNGSHVAMVSDKLVNNLFDGEADKAIGKTIDIHVADRYITVTIVGVYKYEESSMGFSSSSDTAASTPVYIPLKLAKTITKGSGYQAFRVITKNGVDVEKFTSTVQHYLDGYYRNNHNFEPSAFSMAAIVSQMSKIMSTITLAIAAIGGIALIVGGIGVMNIMLVSITERTREIGTRKALGATNNSIRIQFIVEAIIICLVGGIFGIILGIILGVGISNVLKYPTTPSVLSIVISLIFSMAVGVFFGYYPANKAAKMNPIDALRYE